jgi:hypothetical protein
VDLLKILRSLEEFLYEAITWLIFYPRTLWRIVSQPLTMAKYASTEIDQKTDNQFTDAISPPLFLMLTLGLAHVIELSSNSAGLVVKSAIGQSILNNEQNLLIYRSIAFSIWPLVFASAYLQTTKVALDRDSLRGPFFAQCYITAPFALGLSLGTSLIHQPEDWLRVAGLSSMMIGLSWYIITQTRWSRLRLNLGWWRALAFALLQLVIGGMINAAISLLIFPR